MLSSSTRAVSTSHQAATQCHTLYLSLRLHSTLIDTMVEPSVESLRDRAAHLGQQKTTVETRLQEILHQLDSMPGKPGLNDRLVDDEVRAVSSGANASP